MTTPRSIPTELCNECIAIWKEHDVYAALAHAYAKGREEERQEIRDRLIDIALENGPMRGVITSNQIIELLTPPPHDRLTCRHGRERCKECRERAYRALENPPILEEPQTDKAESA